MKRKIKKEITGVKPKAEADYVLRPDNINYYYDYFIIIITSSSISISIIIIIADYDRIILGNVYKAKLENCHFQGISVTVKHFNHVSLYCCSTVCQPLTARTEYRSDFGIFS